MISGQRVRTQSTTAREAAEHAAEVAASKAPKAAKPAASAASKRARAADLQVHAEGVISRLQCAEALLDAAPSSVTSPAPSAGAGDAPVICTLQRELETAKMREEVLASEKGTLAAQLEAKDAQFDKHATQATLDALRAKGAADRACAEAVRVAREETKEAADARFEELRATTDAANTDLQAQVLALEEANRELKARCAALDAAGGQKSRKARKQREAPDSEEAAAFAAGEPAPKRPRTASAEPSPWAQFSCATRAWSVATSGREAFFAAIGVKSVDDLARRLESDAKWAAQLLASEELPEDLEAALRTLTTPPFALNGEQYKTKQLLIARVGWKAAANVTPQSEEIDVGDAELNAHVTNQTKKAVNGVHQLIQAYNLWSQLLGPHKETYQPIPMTAKKETLRKGKPMAAMTAIRAKAGGFASIEEYEASLEAPAAEAAEEAEAAEGEGEGEGVAAVAAVAAEAI
jgi:hypothetical protein